MECDNAFSEIITLSYYHITILDVLSLSAELFYNTIQSSLVDGAQAIRRQLQRDPFVLLGEEKAFGLQIGQKPALGLDIGVRNRVASNRRFTRYLTYSCHDSENFGRQK